MKKYAVIADSSTDLSNELLEKYPVTVVPFKLSFPTREFVDSVDADTEELMNFMKESDEIVNSACPSPAAYLEALNNNSEYDEIFILTISSKLSGSYNAAVVAKNMYLEENPSKKVHIIDSLAASAGTTIIFLKLYDLINNNLPFEEIRTMIEEVKSMTRTLFSSEDFSQLIKNGRMSRVAGNFAQAINLQPIMRDDGHGEVTSEKITRGLKGMIRGVSGAIEKYATDYSNKRLVISHNHAEDKANMIADKVREKFNFKEILIVPTSMLCSTYVSHRGIIVGFERDK